MRPVCAPENLAKCYWSEVHVAIFVRLAIFDASEMAAQVWSLKPRNWLPDHEVLTWMAFAREG